MKRKRKKHDKKSMPKKKRKLSLSDDVSGTQQCTICLEELSHTSQKATQLKNCGHWFHKDCIAYWFNKSNTCPNCRNQEFCFLCRQIFKKDNMSTFTRPICKHKFHRKCYNQHGRCPLCPDPETTMEDLMAAQQEAYTASPQPQEDPFLLELQQTIQKRAAQQAASQILEQTNRTFRITSDEYTTNFHTEIPIFLFNQQIEQIALNAMIIEENTTEDEPNQEQSVETKNIERIIYAQAIQQAFQANQNNISLHQENEYSPISLTVTIPNTMLEEIRKETKQKQLRQKKWEYIIRKYIEHPPFKKRQR